ncbi:hypothetical protein Pfo_001967 [Paulownia fortunei]|nr:hypothetical protein Pfo_001967 [Paulownia fortunei]
MEMLALLTLSLLYYSTCFSDPPSIADISAILFLFFILGKPSNWQDNVGIITLLVLNSTMSFLEENISVNVVASLMGHLAPKAKVLQDGHWNEEDATVLVPEDISIKLRGIIPADACLLEGDPIKAAHLADSTNQLWTFSEGLGCDCNFPHMFYCSGKIIIMIPIQHHAYRPGIDNLLVLLIGGILIAIPTVLCVTLATHH